MPRYILLFSIGLAMIFTFTPAYPENPVKNLRITKPGQKAVSTVACDDGLQCTQDMIVDGKCVHSIKNGFCLINGVCYARNQVNPAQTMIIAIPGGAGQFPGQTARNLCLHVTGNIARPVKIESFLQALKDFFRYAFELSVLHLVKSMDFVLHRVMAKSSF